MPYMETITIMGAMELAKKYGITMTKPTCYRYVREYGLGYQLGGPGGKWVIDKEKFRRFICGKEKRTDQLKHTDPSNSEPNGN